MPLIELYPAHGMLELELGILFDRVQKIKSKTELNFNILEFGKHHIAL